MVQLKFNLHPVRLSYSAESAAIQQCFSLTTNQRTVLSAIINQRNEQAVGFLVVSYNIFPLFS
jgi:hypothetical protein